MIYKVNVAADSTMSERIVGLPVKTWLELISDLDEDVTENKKLIGRGDPDDDSIEEVSNKNPPDNGTCRTPTGFEPLKVVYEQETLPDCAAVKRNASGWCWLSGILGRSEDIGLATREALQTLNTFLTNESLCIRDVVAISLYIRDMSHYSVVNTEYLGIFSGPNPPVRVCVEAPLPENSPVLLEALAYKCEQGRNRRTMHVQGVSHWAPANIGPYSQAVRIGDIIQVAGQIALVPGTMQIVQGGARKQCRLALRHVGRIVRAMDANTQLRDVVQGICYVTHPSYIPDARREWEKRTNNAIVDYLVVPQLPRGALLEWHIWAHRHNNRFEYEETGCCIGDYRVSIRRRWNYENNVAAIVCYVSTSTSNSTSTMSDDAVVKDPTSPQDITDENLSEVLRYALSKLLRKTSTDTVCNLHVFYKVGRSPGPTRIENRLSCLEGFSIVYSIVPVCQLHNSHTFLSICGVRHD